MVEDFIRREAELIKIAARYYEGNNINQFINDKIDDSALYNIPCLDYVKNRMYYDEDVPFFLEDELEYVIPLREGDIFSYFHKVSEDDYKFIDSCLSKFKRSIFDEMIRYHIKRFPADFYVTDLSDDIICKLLCLFIREHNMGRMNVDKDYALKILNEVRSQYKNKISEYIF